jgi:hypothetical protein
MHTRHAHADPAFERPSGIGAAVHAGRIVRATLLCGLLYAGWASAQTRAAAAPIERTDPAREAKVERIVIEDSGSRIEELRVRSQTRSIHVRTKGALAGGYEVLPADPARDSAPGPSNGTGSSGQRVWKVLAF